MDRTWRQAKVNKQSLKRDNTKVYEDENLIGKGSSVNKKLKNKIDLKYLISSLRAKITGDSDKLIVQYLTR